MYWQSLFVSGIPIIVFLQTDNERGVHLIHWKIWRFFHQIFDVITKNSHTIFSRSSYNSNLDRSIYMNKSKMRRVENRCQSSIMRLRSFDRTTGLMISENSICYSLSSATLAGVFLILSTLRNKSLKSWLTYPMIVGRNCLTQAMDKGWILEISPLHTNISRNFPLSRPYNLYPRLICLVFVKKFCAELNHEHIFLKIRHLINSVLSFSIGDPYKNNGGDNQW